MGGGFVDAGDTIVDGVITVDGDTIVFGALRVDGF